MFIWTLSDAIGVLIALVIASWFGVIFLQDWLLRRKRRLGK